MTYVVGLGIIIYLVTREEYTKKCHLHASDVVYLYIKDQIVSGKYEEGCYQRMIMDYHAHVLSFWRWGKYSAIKNKYREILKPYMEGENT